MGPALALGAIAIYTLHGFDGYLSRDLGLYAYAGQRVADGVPPYVGVVNRSGPLSHAVPGIGAALGRVVGLDDVLAMRLLNLVLAGVCIWVAYRLGRDLLESRLAGVASAMALFSITGFSEYASTGPREKTAMVLFLLCAMLALVHRRFGWAGVFVSLATLTWQPAFFVGAVSAFVALSALEPGRRLRGLASVVVCGLVPLIVSLAFYAGISELRVFLNCFVLIHLKYTDQPGAGDGLSDVWQLLADSYGSSLWVLVVGAAALLAAAAAALLLPTRRRDPRQRVVVALAVGVLAGLLWCVRAFNGWPDIFFLLPGIAVGVGWLARELAALVPRPVSLAVTVAWSLAAAAGTLQYALTTGDDTLDIQRANVDAVLGVLPADATVVSIEAPQPLVLSGKVNPRRHQMFSYGLGDYIDATWPGGLDGFAQDIAMRKPTVIAVGTIRPDWLIPILEEEYWEVGTAPGFTWFVNRSVGAGVRAEMQQAHRETDKSMGSLPSVGPQ